MFGFSKNRRPSTCPVPEPVRLWLEGAFLQLQDFFGKEKTQQRKVLTPHYTDFPIQYNGDEENAFRTLKIIATQMEIPFEDIYLELFDDTAKEVSSGSVYGQGLFLGSQNNQSDPSGLYWGKADNGQFVVSLLRSRLAQPENMVATLAHELAHIKLLGEERIHENDERLTDLVTVMFGLGIFNANAAFQTYRGIGYSGWQSMGYLKQMEWGYGLALFAHLRGEDNPVWAKHLTPTVKGDFTQGQNFIKKNSDKVFQQSGV
ncbi:MAG: hypothetical protein J7621_19580 [Niastella sp.]|nr:hypothetical protein [Niastella sp.]